MSDRYPLAKLLSARCFRKEEAAREATLAAKALEDAREQLRLANDELERYRKWRPEEEERRFAVIRGQWLSMSRLDDYRAATEALRLAELQREEACRTAEREAAKAEEEAAAAWRRHAEAAKAVRKLEEHRGRWRRVEDAAREAREEAELEEFSRHFLPEDEANDDEAVLSILEANLNRS